MDKLNLIKYLIQLVNGRTNFEISIIDYSTIKSRNVAHLYMTIHNKSSNPLTINLISICDNENEYPCELVSKVIFKNSLRLLKTPEFPLLLPAKSSNNLFLEFVAYKGKKLDSGNLLTLKVQANRKVKEISSFLPNKSHYLRND